MNMVRSLPELTHSFQDRLSKEKVMIVTADGGPEKSLRYSNTINCTTGNFADPDLDAFFVATNAPGRKTFNRVE